MLEKKRIEIFPKHMGFFPYMWFVYLLFPIYHLVQASGWKLIIGSGMLIILLSHTVSFILCRGRLFLGMYSNDTHLFIFRILQRFYDIFGFSQQVRWDLHQVKSISSIIRTVDYNAWSIYICIF